MGQKDCSHPICIGLFALFNSLRSSLLKFYVKNIFKIFGTKGFSSYLCIAFER